MPLKHVVKNLCSHISYSEKLSKNKMIDCKILAFYTRPQSGQFFMINVSGNQWLSVTRIPVLNQDKQK